MDLLEKLLLALSLAMDAFAVSVSIAVTKRVLSGREKFRIYFHFGLFQFLYPVIGYYLMIVFSFNKTGYGKFIATFLLLILGLKTIYEALFGEEEKVGTDITKGLNLILFSTSVSIDALSVGISLGAVGGDIWLTAVLAGIITSLMSYIGLKYGVKLGERLREYSEILGGIILIAIAIKIGFF